MTLGRQILAALGFTLVSSAVVYGITFLLPKTYESEQVLLLPNSASTSKDLASQFFQGTGGGSGDLSLGVPGGMPFQNIGSGVSAAMGILESRTCRDYVIEKLDLTKTWQMSLQKARAELKKRGRVRQDDNGFLVITGQSDNAEEARRIAATMFEYLDKGANKLTWNLSRRNRATLEEQLIASKKKADNARNELVRTMGDRPYVDKSAISNLLTTGMQKLGEAKANLSATKSKVREYEVMIGRALDRGGDVGALQALGGGTVDAAMATMAQDLQTRRLEFETVQRTFTQDSPEYKAALERIRSGRKAVQDTVRDAKASLKGERFAPLIPVKSELAGLQQSVKVFEATLAEYKRMALRAPHDASIVQMRDAQWQTALRTWQSLESQLAVALIQEERDPARYEVVDEAVLNPEPIAPRKGLITGAWFAGCLALSAWIILRKRIKFVD